MNKGQQITIVDHPLVRIRLAQLRQHTTPPTQFRELTHQLASMLAVPALADFPVCETEVQTPVGACVGMAPAAQVVLVPILRAGLALLNGLLPVLPEARVGHLGMFRDESTLNPIQYYCNLPYIDHLTRVILLDPMLATGNSAVSAVRMLKDRGARQITFVCLLCAPEGLAHLSETCPDVRIVTAAVDSHLNERGYIVPGLGDAGDRYFGN